MRLAAKLILLFLVGLLLIVGVFSFATWRRERDIAIEQHERYAAELATMIGTPDSPATQTDGRDRFQPYSSSRQIRVRRVELQSTDGRRSPTVPQERLFVSEQITTITMPDQTGIDRWYTYVPVSGGNAQDFENAPLSSPTERIEISAPDLASNARTQRTVVSSVLTLLCVSGLSAVVIYFGGVRMVGRPLDRLITKVNRVATGNLDHPVAIGSHDELGDLGQAINSMCDSLAEQRKQIEVETAARISAVEQLRHADRLRWVGRMAAGIAHEIGTPLNVVSGRAELIASGELTDSATVESAAAIKTESDRIAQTISGLLEFAGQRPSCRESTDLRSVIETTVDLLRPIASKNGSTIRTKLPDHEIIADVDRGQFQQVLTNLINNSVQSRPSGVIVNVTLNDQDNSGGITLAVSDNGCGIPPESIEQIFEPFYTTKDVGDGTGLGLAISHGIIQEHDGQLRVKSEVGAGTTFTICLPPQSTPDVGAES